MGPFSSYLEILVIVFYSSEEEGGKAGRVHSTAVLRQQHAHFTDEEYEALKSPPVPSRVGSQPLAEVKGYKMVCEQKENLTGFLYQKGQLGQQGADLVLQW